MDYAIGLATGFYIFQKKNETLHFCKGREQNRMPRLSLLCPHREDVSFLEIFVWVFLVDASACVLQASLFRPVPASYLCDAFVVLAAIAGLAAPMKPTCEAQLSLLLSRLIRKFRPTKAKLIV